MDTIHKRLFKGLYLVYKALVGLTRSEEGYIYACKSPKQNLSNLKLAQMDSFPTEIFNPMDPNNFTKECLQVLDFIADYYKNVNKYPVQSQVEPGYLLNNSPNVAPSSPESLEAILKDVQNTIIPGLTHWQSPNFYAYFPASASTAGFLGEMLCSGLNVIGFNWASSPAATELETLVMDWMGKMLKLPSSFLFSGGGGGVLNGTTCEAIVCTLAAARDKAIKEMGSNVITKLIVYASDQTHFSLQKGSKLIGIPPDNFRSLPTSLSTGFALSPHDVRAAMEQDVRYGFVPLFLCATVGTTATCAVDPLESLGLVAKEHKVWFHIDAAYAGNACICPEFRHYLDGVECADSITMNTHKWFLTNIDCCCLWVKDPELLIDSLSTDPEILRNKASTSKKVVDYKDWQIALSRRFRSIKLWLVIRRYGEANLMGHIRSDVNLAKKFESMVMADERFEMLVPRRFALVCFRLKTIEGDGDDDGGLELNQKLLEAVNSSGRAYMTHAVVGDMYMIRCAIGATLTEEHHVEGAWKLIQEKADLLLGNGRDATERN